MKKYPEGVAVQDCLNRMRTAVSKPQTTGQYNEI